MQRGEELRLQSQEDLESNVFPDTDQLMFQMSSEYQTVDDARSSLVHDEEVVGA